MSLLHIDDRLAGLAEAAARATKPPNVMRRAHPRQVSVSGRTESGLTADHALELTGSVIEAFAAGDVATLGETCSPTVHARTPTADTHGFDELAESMSNEANVFADIGVEVESLLVTGSAVAAEWRLRAAHSGPLNVDWAVIEATGQSITVDGVLIGHTTVLDTDGPERFVFEDIHLYFDTTSLLVQLALT